MDTDLVVLIQRPQIPGINQPPHLLICESNPVVEIAQPDSGIVILNGAIALKADAVRDGAVVTVSLVVIGKAGGQMSGDKADASLMRSMVSVLRWE